MTFAEATVFEAVTSAVVGLGMMALFIALVWRRGRRAVGNNLPDMVVQLENFKPVAWAVVILVPIFGLASAVIIDDQQLPSPTARFVYWLFGSSLMIAIAAGLPIAILASLLHSVVRSAQRQALNIDPVTAALTTKWLRRTWPLQLLLFRGNRARLESALHWAAQAGALRDSSQSVR